MLPYEPKHVRAVNSREIQIEQENVRAGKLIFSHRMKERTDFVSIINDDEVKLQRLLLERVAHQHDVTRVVFREQNAKGRSHFRYSGRLNMNVAPKPSPTLMARIFPP